MFHIMLVDDKEVFRRRIKRLAYWKTSEDRFLISYEAENGLEALELLKDHQVDVVITDIRMPMLDGIELLKRIHNEELCQCVILLSEYADFEYAKQGILNGAFDYILKPIDNEKMSDAMERAYGFLASRQQTKKGVIPGIQPLIKAIVDGDAGKTKKCADRIWKGIRTAAHTEENASIQAEEAFREIVEDLEENLPYLGRYLRLEEFTMPDQAGTEPAFSEKVEKLAKAVTPFLIPKGKAVVSQICERVLSDIGNAPGLQELADEYHMNVKYLGEQFKKETGQGYVQYILKLKIACAEMRLRCSEDKIYEIAYNLGYNDLDYFSKSFKKVTGISPKAYREGSKDG